MKTIIAVFVMFLAVFGVNSQDFKPVVTGQDVIDNYITASGGKDALKDIESIRMKGKIGEGSEAGELEIYFSKNYVYMDIGMKEFSMKQAIDVKKKKGWTKFGEMIKDMTEEEIKKNTKNMDGSMWGNFINPEEFGITYELLQNETIDGTEYYAVDLVRDSLTVSTSYFDMKTFDKVREIKGGMTSGFSDFRKVKDSDVIMPFKITSQTGDVVITDITFNSSFNTKLLKRPKDKKGDDSKNEDK
ncbi:MAG TPA: hypothetical protein PK605_09490 [Ignavibacteria bacterium]|nr:hypothetical protein [Bacteroidota bacterium]HRE10035.1 hypothetical protein [Ignavibacteria bacterium]HRF66898.1 hypothetical protein [Ignavibacteria bacterium]HRJ04621.1 hypothetical protein [Ignavibacteria bacterium]HRJ86459.1 hypothetical protein [Ignavibacteria bacterium]